MLRTLTLALLVSAPPALSSPPAAAQTTNIETPGNLQATRDLKCIAPAELKPVYTAADLAPAAADCIAKGRMEEARFLFGTVLGYTYYDGLRVTDPTAGQARNALAARIGQAASDGDPERFKAWQATLNAAIETGSPLTPEECAVHRDLGPPDYRPDYMIAHGMQAIANPDAEPMKTGLDEKAIWERTLTAFLKCPA